MTLLSTDEHIVARRPWGPGALVLGAALTGLAGVAIFAAFSWLAFGAVHVRGIVVFLAVFTTLSLVGQLLVRRWLTYCLTTRRLILGTGREIPLENIERFRIGAHSLTVEDSEHRHYRIYALAHPAWLATRLNRCRSGGAPDTGICPT